MAQGQWVSRLGFLIGLSLVVAVAFFARIPDATGSAGADVTLASASTGEVSVSPVGPFARGLGLEPGTARQPATGTVKVHNSTGSAADVHVRVLRSIRDLDDLLHVEMTADGAPVYSGPLGGLGSWSAESFRLARGTSADLRVTASLPASVRDGYEARVADLNLEFQLQRVVG